MTYLSERLVTTCPLCDEPTEFKWGSVCTSNADYNPNFNPSREWRYCKQCHHIHAGNIPVDLAGAITAHVDPQYMRPKPQLFPMYSDILNRLDAQAGQSILDVGFGAGELLLVANEMGLLCEGCDIRQEYVDNLTQIDDNMGLWCGGMCAIDLYDIITLGDVLEHVENPLEMLEQAHDKLEDSGYLWISTPNFDSAFSVVAGNHDAMRTVCEHINWFSKQSLDMALEMVGFKPISYDVSKHFNGCMERICVKR